MPLLSSPTTASAPTILSTHTYPHRSVPKTSISHPINISWIVPDEYLPFLSFSDLPDNIDLFDLTDPAMAKQLEPQLEKARSNLRPPSRRMGNLALSSCPGKKVRLTGPVRGRAAINRDLDLDFARMRSFGITTLVCCLDDNELGFLGASWPKYYEAAKRHNLDIIRLPMVEGSCPETIADIHAVVQMVDDKIRQGENVLTHCRGGVGRAGLFACCWLLKNLLCLSAERAIRYVRIRRSVKAIETMRQAEFIIHYSHYVGKLLDQQQHRDLDQKAGFSVSSSPSSSLSPRPLLMAHTDHTLAVPSVSDISSLERAMRIGQANPSQTAQAL
ncbi:hypothetical protein EC973_001060 [Apophysomyces ossiformis]|uniref:Tyrosine specific protein phosphatases domain-containing protein n=1 Tax=Apophysomyces ossiformis TaxID=679940 RepID=A0A8H7BYL8_9FUNG|nr:hypothetical protein EC973_001060 [Apophysomyces ossiformis]